MFLVDPILALQCGLQEALGMESGAISDGQISASSEYSAKHVASRGRLHSQTEGIKTGAWSSAIVDANQWLQVFFLTYISNITYITLHSYTYCLQTTLLKLLTLLTLLPVLITVLIIIYTQARQPNSRA